MAMEKRAVKRVVRDDMGRARVILIDLDTLQEVTDPKGYKIINANNGFVEPVASVEAPDAVEPPATVGSQIPGYAPETGQQTQTERAMGLNDFPSAPSRQSQVSTGTGKIGQEAKAQSVLGGVMSNRGAPTGYNPQGAPIGTAPNPSVFNDSKKSIASEITKGTVKGGGLAELAKSADKAMSGSTGISYGHTATRGDWTTNLSKETQDVANAMSGIMGGMNMTSAYRSPEINTAVGGAKNSMHKSGQAFDVSTKGWTDKQKSAAVAAGIMAGATRVGTYKDESLHFDVNPHYSDNTKVPDLFAMYQGANIQKFKESSIPGWYKDGLEMARTTTAVPTPAPEDRTTAKSIISDAKSITKSNDKFAGVDLSKASPAQMSSLGLRSRSPSEIDKIAFALSGELSPQQMAALSKNDPVARAELANMVTTIENRTGNAKYGSIDKALTPDQYNSLMSGRPMANTTASYDKYKDTITKAVSDYYTGELQPTDYNLTNYYNADIVSPSWGNKMTSVGIMGNHTFGALTGPYDNPFNDPDFLSERSRLSQAQISDTRGWTPSMSSNFSSTTGRGISGIGSDFASSRDYGNSGGYTGAGISTGNLGGLGAGYGSVGAERGGDKGGYSGGGISTSGLGGLGGGYSGGAASGSTSSSSSSGSSTNSGIGGSQSGPSNSGPSGSQSGASNSGSSQGASSGIGTGTGGMGPDKGGWR